MPYGGRGRLWIWIPRVRIPSAPLLLTHHPDFLLQTVWPEHIAETAVVLKGLDSFSARLISSFSFHVSRLAGHSRPRPENHDFEGCRSGSTASEVLGLSRGPRVGLRVRIACRRAKMSAACHVWQDLKGLSR